MKYLVRSILTFLVLYGLVAWMADQLYFGAGLTLGLGMQIAMLILLLQYLIGPWVIRKIMDIDWDQELPVRNQEFLRALCEREQLPLPKIGIIHGAAPNAFTFGRNQADASIVVTDGLLDLLTVDEVNSVIAHEAGHIKHRDFLALTAAALAPLLLWQIYAAARRLKDDHWITYGVYAAYWVSELVVLSLSRIREYWADDFAARATGNPSHLATALVKICYGMARVERAFAWARKHGDEKQKTACRAQALLSGKIGVMGISTAEPAFALTGGDPNAASRAMRWDLENPWARIYELMSTHPLTARRIGRLNHMAASAALAIECPLPTGTRLRWGSFPVEFLLWTMPWALPAMLMLAAGLTGRGVIELPQSLFVAGAAMVGLVWLARISYRYQGEFKPATIASLLEDVRPSGMLPRAVRIEGQIVGRGDPEAFWSPDLLIQDDTGMMFMLDRQSIPLARLILASSAESLVGRRVSFEGWYRRGPSPHVELSRLECEGSDEAKRHVHRSYSRWIQMGAAVAGTIAFYALFMARAVGN